MNADDETILKALAAGRKAMLTSRHRRRSSRSHPHRTPGLGVGSARVLAMFIERVTSSPGRIFPAPRRLHRSRKRSAGAACRRSLEQRNRAVLGIEERTVKHMWQSLCARWACKTESRFRCTRSHIIGDVEQIRSRPASRSQTLTSGRDHAPKLACPPVTCWEAYSREILVATYHRTWNRVGIEAQSRTTLLFWRIDQGEAN